ncbi:MAG: hypothetical protein LBR51_04890 [Bacteroidales bacterium]|jgi:hypothetical protein|nr:hypothetical protein [Bacteroidales bacterium]
MRIFFGIGLFFLFACNVFAQPLTDYLSTDFEDIPAVSIIEDSLHVEEGAWYLKQKIVIDYHYNQEGSLDLWRKVYSSVKIYDTIKMAHLKKWIFPRINQMITIKSRLIRNGKVVQIIGKENLKESTNSLEDEDENEDAEEELPVTKRHITYLEFDHIESGDIIEFLGILSVPTVEYDRITLQNPLFCREMSCTLILPGNLDADVRTYHGLPLAKDTILIEQNKRCYYCNTFNIAAAPKEPVTFYNANLACMDYVINRNYARGRARFNSFATYGQQLYTALSALSSGDKRALQNLVRKMNISPKADTRTRVMLINSYVKKHIAYDPSSSANRIKEICQNKRASGLGLTRLYFHLFLQEHIYHEIVLTSNKTQVLFDPTFDAVNHLNELLFYFPALDDFISPDWLNFNLDYPPYVLTGQPSVFYEMVKQSNGNATFVPRVLDIPALPTSANGDTLKINLVLDAESGKMSGKIYRALWGYPAINLQQHFDLLPPEAKEYVVEHYLALGNENTIITREQFENTGREMFGSKPMVMRGDIASFDFTKLYEDSIVIKIGQLIGEQANIPASKDRKMPVQLNYLEHYERTFNIILPEKYKVIDFSQIQKAVYDNDDSKQATAAFIVTAKQHQNVLTILCREYYKKLSYEPENFENYRRVVEAANTFHEKATLTVVKTPIKTNSIGN